MGRWGIVGWSFITLYVIASKLLPLLLIVYAAFTPYLAPPSPGKPRGEALMKQVRQCVEKAEPDVIIEVDSDHVVNFFYNNLPSFCVGMAEEAS